MITVEGVEEFTCIEDAMQYIKGYCNKHKSCEQEGKYPCRLYDPARKECFLYAGVVPGDWNIIKDGEDADV